MTKYLVFGHKNPDTDSIASAIAMSFFLEKLGHESEPVALGEVNEETAFALTHFNVEAPRVVSSVSNEVSNVALVDHNEAVQSVDDLGEVAVDYVVDHHRIGFESPQPLYYRCEPIGCTATVLYKMFNEHQFDIPKAMAGLMLSAIISDTLLFKSPTCTHTDVDAAHELAKIAEVSLNEYGLELLKAGTNLATKSISELLTLDSKNFDMNGRTVRVAQVNAIGFDDVLLRKEAVLNEMQATIQQEALDMSILLVTDVLESNSVGLVVGNDTTPVEKAFKQPVIDAEVNLPGVVSRKKQIIPQLTETYNTL